MSDQRYYYYGPPHNNTQNQYNIQGVSGYHAAAQAHYAAQNNWSIGAWRSSGPMRPLKPQETKPRMAKEEVELLESEFQRDPKPNTSLKKGLAVQMKVPVTRINVSSRRLFHQKVPALTCLRRTGSRIGGPGPNRT